MNPNRVFFRKTHWPQYLDWNLLKFESIFQKIRFKYLIYFMKIGFSRSTGDSDVAGNVPS